jgi:acyl-CoA dehydrogenase
MDIELAPEHAELRRTLRRFVQEKLEPLAREIDATGETPAEVFTTLGKHGYLGMRLPAEVGGAEVGIFEYCIVLEEFSRSHRIFSNVVNSTSGLVPNTIARHGSPTQKKKYFSRLSAGELKTAFALTEPGSGSDAAAMTTRAEKVNGGWVLNGRKHYISGGQVAHVIMVMAVTDPEKRSRGGISSFLVDSGTPGFSVTRVDTTMGSEAVKLAELTFEDCFVTDDALLGEVGNGFKFAMETLDEGRIGVACSCIGAADRLLTMAIDHASDRHTFGKPLSERQAIQWMLADSLVELTAARSMTYEMLRRIEAGEKVGSASSMCKLFASEMANRVADRSVQIHGGQGLIRGFPVERFYRDLRHTRVGEGSSEMQRMIIARRLFQSRKQARETA